LHGPRFIIIEFGVGTPAILAFGLFVAYTGQGLIGAYILLTGVNYVPLLAYATVIVRAGTAKFEIAEEMASDRHYVRKYSTQQLLVFIPFAVLLLAVAQELKKQAPDRA